MSDPTGLRRKLDARSRRRLRRGELSGEVSMLVRLQEVASVEQKRRLEDVGCRVQYETGDVLTAEAPVERLEELAELSFVRRIELSRPLFQESHDLRRKTNEEPRSPFASPGPEEPDL